MLFFSQRFSVYTITIKPFFGIALLGGYLSPYLYFPKTFQLNLFHENINALTQPSTFLLFYFIIVGISFYYISCKKKWFFFYVVNFVFLCAYYLTLQLDSTVILLLTIFFLFQFIPFIKSFVLKKEMKNSAISAAAFITNILFVFTIHSNIPYLKNLSDSSNLFIFASLYFIQSALLYFFNKKQKEFINALFLSSYVLYIAGFIIYFDLHIIELPNIGAFALYALALFIIYLTSKFVLPFYLSVLTWGTATFLRLIVSLSQLERHPLPSGTIKSIILNQTNGLSLILIATLALGTYLAYKNKKLPSYVMSSLAGGTLASTYCWFYNDVWGFPYAIIASVIVSIILCIFLLGKKNMDSSYRI